MQSRIENKCANRVQAYFHEPQSGGKQNVCWRGHVLRIPRGGYKTYHHHHPFVLTHLRFPLCPNFLSLPLTVKRSGTVSAMA